MLTSSNGGYRGSEKHALISYELANLQPYHDSAHPEKNTHSKTPFLQLVYIANDTGAEGNTTGYPNILNEAPRNKIVYVLRDGYLIRS